MKRKINMAADFGISVPLTIMVLLITKISDAGLRKIPLYELHGMNPESLDLLPNTQYTSVVSSSISLPYSISSPASYSSQPSVNSNLSSTSTSSSVSLPLSNTSTPVISPSEPHPLRLSSSTPTLVPSPSTASLPFSSSVPTPSRLSTSAPSFSTTSSLSFEYIPIHSSRLIPTPAPPSTPNPLYLQGSTMPPHQLTLPTPLHLLSSIRVPFSASSSVPLKSDLVPNLDLTSISESILYELLLELLDASIDDTTYNILEAN